ncbi:MAG: 5'/3'-nucleotidase SurE [Bacillota bacterium]|nr:5'/3'-nucleotidase SurE [Bacillota bacterium]
MNILITNDDSIYARGIRELAEALAQVAEIYIFAPDVQKSACGHGITAREPIEVTAMDVPGTAGAWKVTGTPADCVKLGLDLLKKDGISVDMVFSGINHGANLGTDVIYSGTVSGAIEGIINNIPSVAVSVDNHNPVHFETCRKMAVEAVRAAAGKLDGRTVLNINAPDIPHREIKGIRYTVQGPREYSAAFVPHPEAENTYVYAGAPVLYDNLPENMDVVAVQDGYVSITPLQFDLTRHPLTGRLAEWGFAL